MRRKSEKKFRKKHKDHIAPKLLKFDLAPMAAEALKTSMIPHQSRDDYLTCMSYNNDLDSDGTYIVYGKGWTNASNTPFRISPLQALRS